MDWDARYNDGTVRMTLPGRRTRPKMGCRDGIRRTFPAHRAWVRRHCCVVTGCNAGPIQFCHVKSRGAGGGDWYGVSMCLEHHDEQHKGIKTFERKYAIDLYALAAEFAARTTDKALRAELFGAGT